MTPVLTTPRLTLRPLAMTDAPALFAARRDEETMRYWDWPAQSRIEQVEQIIEDHQPQVADGNVLWWVAVTHAGQIVGECDLSDIDTQHRRAEAGFLFNRDHWGKGYALEAMTAVCTHAFGGMKLHRLWARVHRGNAASQKLLKRLGFSHEGVLRDHVYREGLFRDCEIWGLLR